MAGIRRIRKRLICLLVFVYLIALNSVWGAETPPDTSSEKTASSVTDGFKKTFGMTYFSYFNGPGLHPDAVFYNPNQLGYPTHDGINFMNQFSIRYKFSNNLAIDLQNRFRLILNNNTANPEFQVIRWETPRIGISGKLWQSGDWSLIGAVNTDFPYFLPPPFAGYQAKQRTVLFNPGMFAALKYEPKHSRWSFFSVVNPRYFIYMDRDAAEVQLTNSGFSARNKPELIIGIQPTINYALTEKMKLTLGSGIDYRKQVLSDWNPLRGSFLTNGDDPAWRLDALPIIFGVTYTIDTYLTVFPYFATFPIAEQRVDANTGKQASLLESSSIGMWISGTLF